MTADRDALLDVIGAIEGYARGDQRLATLLGSASRARRHLDRTADGELPAREEPPVGEEVARPAQSVPGHALLPWSDLGWQPTGWTSPAVYRVDVTCECGQGTTITAPAGREVAVAAAEAWHPWHLRVVDLEARLVRAFAGEALLPGSTLCLTERAAERMARIALDVFTAATYAGEPEEGGA